MERDERVRRYLEGGSIYSIAKDAKVSRQSVMRSLRRAGVYPRDEKSEPVVKTEEVRDSRIEKGACPFDPFRMYDQPKRDGTITNNLYVKGDKFAVFDIRKGGMRTYDSLEAVKKEYGIE